MAKERDEQEQRKEGLSERKHMSRRSEEGESNANKPDGAQGGDRPKRPNTTNSSGPRRDDDD